MLFKLSIATAILVCDSQGHSSAIEEGQAALLSLDKEFEKKR